MLRRVSTTVLAALLLVAATDVAGAEAAQPTTSLSSALRVVPDTRAELRDLPPAVHAQDPAEPEPGAQPDESAPAGAPEPDAAEPPAPAPPAAVWPVDRGAAITDGFGPREAPTAGASSNHRGIDFGAAAGTPVLAAASGIVTHVVPIDQGGCGVEVIIQHGEDVGSVSTRSCHLLDGSALVEVGTVVAAGQQIGAVGSTGVSTGPHLHFEVLIPGGEAIDPLPWLERFTAPAG
ncbi:M23 family metallopeptidase [Leifsonia sp. fls2-241-R2A-40a]|uniref:M23 family metallopeptidase n=1 Tax=Leifsonia sp. fls2-241-R2A-40a TaxID=3040290 RepID=UPI00254B4C4B|nr:M23 family metallopeptidase [Leifsonia sp. fls2-241-R2A-40a]